MNRNDDLILMKYVTEFINYKKHCGYKYDSEINVLINYAKYYQNLNIMEIKFSRDIVEPFLTLKENERIANQQNKATILRQFGKFLFFNGYIEDLYIIPPISLKGESEYIPYIFTKKELKDILYYLDNYTDIVKMPKGCFEHNINMLNSVKTIIKILMFTGMRIGEVCNLKFENIDLENNIFYVDEAKNDNRRLVPFSDSLKKILIDYMKISDLYSKGENCYLFFHIDKNNSIFQIRGYTVYYYFRKALDYNNIPHEKGKGPRIHDFRHTFATMSLTQLVSQNECDINSNLLYLSTYLGHRSFNETQKYIWLTAELFNNTLTKMSDYSSIIKNIFESSWDSYEE